MPHVENPKVDWVMSGRLGFWRGVVDHSFESPILGHGPDGYRLLPSRIQGQVQPHSSLFQLVVEFGWVGGMIILVIFWRFFRQFYTGTRPFGGSNNSEHLQKSMLAFISAFLLFSLIDGLLYHALPLAHFAILSAITVRITFHIRRTQVEIPEDEAQLMTEVLGIPDV